MHPGESRAITAVRHRSRGRLLLVPAIIAVVVGGALLAAHPAAPPSTADRQTASASSSPSVATELSPDIADVQANVARGFAELQLARETGDPASYTRADHAFGAALRTEPDNVEALIGQGTLALARHDFARGLAIARGALRLNPSVPSILGVMGDAQVELGRYRAAINTVQRMVDMRPDIASYSRVAYQRELHGDMAGAIEAMRLAVSAAGPATENTEYVRVQLGNLYFGIGDLDKAASTYEESLARYPDYVHALTGLARVEAAQGDLAAAIRLYRRAAERLPLPEIVIGLGETLEAAGRTDEAADQYALVEAMQQLFAANGVRTDLELAAFFADHGDTGEAVRLARLAYADRPTVFAADTLAWALHRDGRTREAQPLVRRALRLETQSSRILYHAGIIEAAMGDIRAAKRHLVHALGLNPAFSPLDASRAAAALEALER